MSAAALHGYFASFSRPEAPTGASNRFYSGQAHRRPQRACPLPTSVFG